MACSHGAKRVDVIECVSDPDSGGFQCIRNPTDQGMFFPYGMTANWVGHSPEDDKAIMDACRLTLKGKP